MTIVVENAGVLPITISEHDYLAIGLGEDDIPSLDAYMQIHAEQEKFQSKIKWKTGEIKGKDEERKIDSLREDRMIIIVIHKVRVLPTAR